MDTEKILDHFDPNEELIEDWKIYIGPGADYYTREWLKIKSGHILSFNLSAMCFNVFWMLYRKMYQPAILYLSFFFAEGFIETLIINFQSIPVNLVQWNFFRLSAFCLILGFLGNWTYYSYAQAKILDIKTKHRPPHHKEYLKLSGGTSFFPIFFLILVIALAVCFHYILIQYLY